MDALPSQVPMHEPDIIPAGLKRDLKFSEYPNDNPPKDHIRINRQGLLAIQIPKPFLLAIKPGLFRKQVSSPAFRIQALLNLNVLPEVKDPRVD